MHQPSRWEIAFLLWDKMLFMNLIHSIYFYQPYYWSTWGSTAIIHGCNCSPTLLFWQDSSNFTHFNPVLLDTSPSFYFLFPSVRVGNMSSEWISLLASRIWMNFHLRFMFLHSGSYALMSLDFLFISLRLLVQVVCSNFHHVHSSSYLEDLTKFLCGCPFYQWQIGAGHMLQSSEQYLKFIDVMIELKLFSKCLISDIFMAQGNTWNI
jgi:hypothetical protein